MGQSATTDNGAVKTVDAILKEALDLGLLAVETALNAYVPITAIPVIRQIINFGLSWIEGKIYEAIATEGTYLVLRFETSIEKSSYMQTVSDLKAAQIEGDPLKVEAARKAFADAASSFIHDDGSAQP